MRVRWPVRFVADGVFAVHKPAGLLCGALLSRLKRELGPRRIGHGGTLDPLASGVIVIGVNRGTKQLAHYLTGCVKEYVVQMSLGSATDTLDSTGEVTRRAPYAHVTREQLEHVLRAFVGDVVQTPPRYSALRTGTGKRAYELARSGIDVEMKPRTVHIDRIDLEQFDLPHATLRVRCGSGTYMRTLCDDVGRALDTAAHMSALQRTLHGDFALGDALGEAQWTSEAIEAALRQPERTVEHAGDGDGSGDDDDDGEAGGGPPAAASA